jgi:hypothetical protein
MLLTKALIYNHFSKKRKRNPGNAEKNFRIKIVIKFDLRMTSLNAEKQLIVLVVAPKKMTE